MVLMRSRLFPGLGLAAMIGMVLSACTAGGSTPPPTSAVPAQKPAVSAPTTVTSSSVTPVAASPAAKTAASPAVKAAASPVAKTAALGAPLPTDPAVLEAARKEGSVVYYTATNAEFHAELAKLFADKTGGVRLDIVELSTGAALNRILREYQANLQTADVIDAQINQVSEFTSKGMFAPYKPAATASYPPGFVDPDGYYSGNRTTLYTVVYNTNLVKGADIPKTWKDVADPKWKDKISSCTPLISSGCLEQMLILNELYGWEYFEKLKANGLLVTSSSSEPANKANSGERVVGLGTPSSTIEGLATRGNPVANAWPEEGHIQAIIVAGILSNAPHPNAAKVLADFLHSPEGQQFQSDTGFPVPSPNVQAPPGRRALTDVKLHVISPERLAREGEPFKEKWRDLFGG
jgi:iron(III) transport system substrate-binding protein